MHALQSMHAVLFLSLGGIYMHLYTLHAFTCCSLDRVYTHLEHPRYFIPFTQPVGFQWLEPA